MLTDLAGGVNLDVVSNLTAKEDKKMSSTELVLSIADGSMSVSRVARIIKSYYGFAIPVEDVASICKQYQIPTPARATTQDSLAQSYPDKWSVALEGVSCWVRVRRYWGDDAAVQLKDAISKSSDSNFRGIYSQLSNYTTSAIVDRQNIDFLSEIFEPIELERLFSLCQIKDLYIGAYAQVFQRDTSFHAGVKFPTATPEWHEYKKLKYIQDSILLSQEQLPTDESVIGYFIDFWGVVKKNRGKHYFKNLEQSLCGSGQSIYQKPFYSATEKHFRHFLHNLNGFKSNENWRVVMMRDPNMPLPMLIEGLLHRYGWKTLHSLIAIAAMCINTPKVNSIDRIGNSDDMIVM